MEKMIAAPSDEILRKHHVFIPSDNPFQRSARLRQALWLKTQGYPMGQHRNSLLGSRLQMPHAEEHLWNYLTDGIREVVRAELSDDPRNKGKVFTRPRIFDDLLSSQPLCFNLFGELKQDLPLAGRVMRRLMPTKIANVTKIEFEYSPGRGDPRYTEDRSAFDVYVEYKSLDCTECFLGIEVKYHEDMDDAPARHRERYDQVASTMACFHSNSLPDLRRKPINQLWRDHLLAGSMMLPDKGRKGIFVVLHPKENSHVVAAVEKYKGCLADSSTFTSWTLESFIAALKAEISSSWVDELKTRYLG
jgi:hypothetical protein